MQLAHSVERIVSEQGPVRLGVLGVIGGFVLCFLSLVVGLGSLSIPLSDGSTKQVGFLFSLNWSLTFLVLFPLFLMFAALQVGQAEHTLRQFVRNKIIAGANGEQIGDDEILLQWKNFNGRCSIILWAFITVILLQTVWQWWELSASPVLSWQIDNQPRDWAVAPILIYPEEPTRKFPLVFFSLAAYAYMGAALFVYLSIVVYSLSVTMFLFEVSKNVDKYRMMFKYDEVKRSLSIFYANAFVSVFLGLIAAFLMQVQVNYLESGKVHVMSFMFQDVSAATEAFAGGGNPFQGLDSIWVSSAVVNPSAFTSLALAAFSLICIVGITYALDLILQNAKNYTLKRKNESDWLDLMNMSSDDIGRVEKARFVNTIIAQPRDYVLCVFLILLSMVFVGIGTFFVSAIVVGLLTLGWKRLRRAISDGDIDRSPMADPPAPAAS